MVDKLFLRKGSLAHVSFCKGCATVKKMRNGGLSAKLHVTGKPMRKRRGALVFTERVV